MNARLILSCIGLLVWTNVSFAAGFQGPAGEVIKRPPPPVDEKAAARAQQAARLRRQAVIADQFELELKTANAATQKYRDNYSSNNFALSHEGFNEAEAAYQRAAKLR